jgi:hypothetical protein
VIVKGFGMKPAAAFVGGFGVAGKVGEDFLPFAHECPPCGRSERGWMPWREHDDEALGDSDEG